MTDDEQRSYQESLDRVSLCHPPNMAAPMLAGSYVTPMPPQVRPSSSSSRSSIRQSGTAEQSGTTGVNKCSSSSSSSRQSNLAEGSDASGVKEQRTNRRDGACGSSSGHATEQQNGNASGSQQTDNQSTQKEQNYACSQGTEHVEATAPQPLSKHAKKKAKRNKCKQALQNTAGNAL